MDSSSTSHQLVTEIKDVLLSPSAQDILELGMSQISPLSSAKTRFYGNAFSYIGAGTGIVSLTLGALRSSKNVADGGRIIATDLRSWNHIIYECVH